LSGQACAAAPAACSGSFVGPLTSFGGGGARGLAAGSPRGFAAAGPAGAPQCGGPSGGGGGGGGLRPPPSPAAARRRNSDPNILQPLGAVVSRVPPRNWAPDVTSSQQHANAAAADITSAARSRLNSRRCLR
jgi:hypothetical protein